MCYRAYPTLVMYWYIFVLGRYGLGYLSGRLEPPTILFTTSLLAGWSEDGPLKAQATAFLQLQDLGITRS